jgi:hypothetical protein
MRSCAATAADILGVVGDRYRPLQNRDQFEWFQPFLDSKECAFETCGALKGGALVWVLAKINRDDAQIGAGDAIRKYLLAEQSTTAARRPAPDFARFALFAGIRFPPG